MATNLWKVIWPLLQILAAPVAAGVLVGRIDVFLVGLVLVLLYVVVLGPGGEHEAHRTDVDTPYW